MEIFGPDDLPVVLEIGKAQIRSTEAGGMTVTFYRLPAGADARSLLQGLPGGSCQCPHWGYVISGRLRIHTADGPHEVLAGQAFHVEPGHAPEAVEDTQMFEVSPSPEPAKSGHIWKKPAALCSNARSRTPPLRPARAKAAARQIEVGPAGLIPGGAGLCPDSLWGGGPGPGAGDL